MLPGEKVILSGLEPAVLEHEVSEALDGLDDAQIKEFYDVSVRDFRQGGIVKGRIVEVVKDEVIVDIGYKCEGFIPSGEFDREDALKSGDEIEVQLERIEDDSGLLILSKRKADRSRAWSRIIQSHAIGDIVRGKATRKTKGGLLVDIGVPVFLPASQIDVRRVGDIGEYLGREVEGKIIKIDEDRHNIVISRRKLLEEERDRMKADLFSELERGQVRRGVVKNITDFGAFVDLGGIDGLLHVTDLAWSRVGHPSEVVAVGQTLEVKVLDFDRERERISLGLKHLTPNPWAHIEEKYPVASRVKGEVVSIMPYGAFIRLEPGVEGLVHISEMSWTRQIAHPSEVVKVGDQVEVVVLEINPKKQEVSLGMKQAEENPWTHVEDKYPTGSRVKGRVRNLTSYGAFVELGDGIDGLLHVSDMSWTKKIPHPSAALKKGDEIEAIVIAVDQSRKRLALSLKHLQEDPWLAEIPAKFHVGQVLEGTITKLTSFGAFVEIDKDLEGLLHISEIADRKIDKPEEVVQAGQKVTVKVLHLDPQERKIGLSIKAVAGGESAEKVERDTTDYSKYIVRAAAGTGVSLGQALARATTEQEAGETAAAKAPPAPPGDLELPPAPPGDLELPPAAEAAPTAPAPEPPPVP